VYHRTFTCLSEPHPLSLRPKVIRPPLYAFSPPIVLLSPVFSTVPLDPYRSIHCPPSAPICRPFHEIFPFPRPPFKLFVFLCWQRVQSILLTCLSFPLISALLFLPPALPFSQKSLLLELAYWSRLYESLVCCFFETYPFCRPRSSPSPARPESSLYGPSCRSRCRFPLSRPQVFFSCLPCVLEPR